MLNNLGGATPPYFRGPDGQYRFANMHTIEPQDVHDHRLRALRGVKIDDLTGPEMPEEDVIAARHAKPASRQAAVNDNAKPSTKNGSAPRTWGEAAMQRIGQQPEGFRAETAFGSTEPPRVTGRPK